MFRALQMIAMIAASNFLFATHSFAANRSCDAEAVNKTLKTPCQDFSKSPLDLRKNKSEADGVLFNFFLVTQQKHFAEIQKFGLVGSSELRKRTLAIAESVKKSAIQYVTGGKPTDQLSGEIAAFELRLRTVKIELADASDIDCFSSGDPGVPNASYTAASHTIKICPAAQRVPSAEIALTIAHELGHSVSPCYLSMPLLKMKAGNRSFGACLLKIEDGAGRTEEDKEIWGNGPISVAARMSMETSTDYGVDINPEDSDDLIRCEAVERIPDSQVKNSKFYRTISHCLERRYYNDFEHWLAKRLFEVDKKPDFSKLPEPERTEWAQRFSEAKVLLPPQCYRKADEHFADSFSGQVYSIWGKENSLSQKQYAQGLHFLTNIECLRSIKSETLTSDLEYPSNAERIALILEPKYAADRIGCTSSAREICSLSEHTFTASAVKQKSNSRGISR